MWRIILSKKTKLQVQHNFKLYTSCLVMVKNVNSYIFHHRSKQSTIKYNHWDNIIYYIHFFFSQPFCLTQKYHKIHTVPLSFWMVYFVAQVPWMSRWTSADDLWKFTYEQWWKWQIMQVFLSSASLSWEKYIEMETIQSINKLIQLYFH